VTSLSLRSDPVEREQLRHAHGLVLLDRGRLRAGERRLFVECGDGWVVEEAWRRVRRGYACGVDRSATLIARANALRAVPGTVEFMTWDGERLPWPDGGFDHVMSTFLMEGDGDPGVVLTEMRRVLHPGGMVELLVHPGYAGRIVDSLGHAGFEDTVAVAGCEVDVARCEVNLEGHQQGTATFVRARSPSPARDPNPVSASAS
jgi:SAM-dependent methyltransferase